MKKLFSLCFVSILLAVSSCTGPVGPAGLPGPQGLPGADGAPGGIEYAKAFEFITNFNTANDFSVVEPYGFEVFESDVTLVYVLWDVLEDGTDVWRLLPQTVYLSNGILSYNFDFTLADVSIFLDGTVPSINAVPDTYRIDQVFRVVVIPAEFVAGGRQDFNYEKVTKAYNITEKSFTRRDLR